MAQKSGGWGMIRRKGFKDEEKTFFTSEKHWRIDCGGVAWIRISGWCDLFLSPETARAVAAELIAIADSVDREQAESEWKKKQ